MVIGAAGGLKIISGVAQTIIRNQFLKESVNKAIETKRVYINLEALEVQHEQGVDQVRHAFEIKNTVEFSTLFHLFLYSILDSLYLFIIYTVYFISTNISDTKGRRQN